MSGLDYASMTRDELRPLVVNALKADGFPTTDAGQCRGEWNKKRFVEFMTTRSAAPPVDTWTDTSFDFEAPVAEPVELAPVAEAPAPAEPAKVETAYEEFHRVTGRGRHPDVVRKEKEANAVKAALPPVDRVSPATVKTALPHSRPEKVKPLANGRDLKGVAKFENWYGQVYPIDLTYPAWKALTKPQTDIANVCRAKHGHAAKFNVKDSTGHPKFTFLVSEAVNFFKFTRPTFLAGVEHLVKIGFIERVVHGGGVVDGKGIKSWYRLSEKWKTYQPELKKYPNMDKARKEMLRKREEKNQNPS